MPLISVIVPVYNVEKYLNECIDSLLNQSYHNLEIILVDDGSTDSSPAICDDYANKDKRVKALHMKNGGQATARNSGIDICTGEYIFFIDSDDYIEKDTIQFLYNKLTENNADISAAAFYFLYKNCTIPTNDYIIEKNLTPEQAFVDVMTMEYLFPCPHGKLYKRDVFKTVRFPNGMLYEDAYAIGEIFHAAKSIYATSAPKLFYRQCKGSTMHKKFNEKTMHLIKVYEHCVHIAKTYFPSAINICKYRYLDSIFVVLQKMIESDAQNIPQFNYVVGLAKKNFWSILFEKRFSAKRRLSAFLLVISPRLYIKVYSSSPSSKGGNECFE